MRRRRLFIMISLLLATVTVPCWDRQAGAQAGSAAEDRAAAMERLRERAERVQAKRKARISLIAARQAAAERAKAAREKGASKQTAPDPTAPAPGGKGGAK